MSRPGPVGTMQCSKLKGSARAALGILCLGLVSSVAPGAVSSVLLGLGKSARWRVRRGSRRNLAANRPSSRCFHAGLRSPPTMKARKGDAAQSQSDQHRPTFREFHRAVHCYRRVSLT
jgi:hypothetical protein